MAAVRRVALVTGATGLLGRVVTAELAGDDRRLGLIGSDGARLDALVAELGVGPDASFTHAADLRDARATAAAVEAVLARFGRLDIVIHAIGGWSGGTPVSEVDPAEFATMLDQHFWTSLNVLQATVPTLVKAGWGRILAASSPVAMDPAPKLGPYAVAKAAQETLFATVAREVAGTGVTANVVLVRSIRAATSGEPAAGGDRGTSPEQISATLRWLASDAAGAVNGARIPLYAATA